MDDQEVKARRQELVKQTFDDWMRDATTRFMISLIPTGSDKDALMALLQNAFEHGFTAGSSSLAIEMLTFMLTEKPKK